MSNREIEEKDWENLRIQLKVLVDVYCEMNDDIYKIKDLLKKLVKYVKNLEKDPNGRKGYLPKKKKTEDTSSAP